MGEGGNTHMSDPDPRIVLACFTYLHGRSAYIGLGRSRRDGATKYVCSADARLIDT